MTEFQIAQMFLKILYVTINVLITYIAILNQ